jgi:hypothetical protein
MKKSVLLLVILALLLGIQSAFAGPGKGRRYPCHKIGVVKIKKVKFKAPRPAAPPVMAQTMRAGL